MCQSAKRAPSASQDCQVYNEQHTSCTMSTDAADVQAGGLLIITNNGNNDRGRRSLRSYSLRSFSSSSTSCPTAGEHQTDQKNSDTFGNRDPAQRFRILLERSSRRGRLHRICREHQRRWCVCLQRASTKLVYDTVCLQRASTKLVCVLSADSEGITRSPRLGPARPGPAARAYRHRLNM